MPAKTKWTPSLSGDLDGKLVLVTGASSGIGLEAARVLAHKHARVILAVRNPAKGEKARQSILSQSSSAQVEVLPLDLADLNSIREFVKSFKKAHKQLDILINNAGVMTPPYSQTKDGFELQMGTNHLGHFALTGLLLPLLQKTPGSRVVNVSSMAHKVGNIDFSDLHWQRRKYRKVKAYGDSKLANLYFTYELARRLPDKTPLVTAAHPGWTSTELTRHITGRPPSPWMLAQPTAMGALPTLRAALDPHALPGYYYGPDGFMEMGGYPVRVESTSLSHQADPARLLWELSTELTGVDFGL